MIYVLTKKQTLINTSNEIKYIKRIADIKKAIEQHNTIALDTETTGLNPLSDRIIMLQIGVGNDQYVIDARDYDISKFKDILEDDNKVIVGQNIKFDYNMLKRHDIVLKKVFDIMLAENVIYNGYYSQEYIKKTKRFSLKGIANNYLKINLDKEIRDTFHNINHKVFNYDQIIYGAKDVEVPLKVLPKQIDKINQLKLRNCVRLENKVTLALGDIEYNGLYLNKDKWFKIQEVYSSKIKETEKKLDELVLKQPNSSKYRKVIYQQDLFDKSYENRRKTNINWSSTKQVYEILTELFNIYPTDKHGKPSTGDKAIKYLPKRYDITDLLLEYRKQEKILSSFGNNFFKYVDIDNRIHTNYKQIVETGRVSSNKPNIQQIPRDELFRSCFEAEKGNKIITADYDNQEGRIMANMANDKDYIDFFNNGDGDAHSFIATKMFSAAFGKEFIVTRNNENKEYRQKGKTINFAISFGGTEFSLSKDLKISIEEAKELINNFYKGFPKLKEFFTACQNYGLNNGYILTNTVINRRRYFTEYPLYLEYKNRNNLSKDEYKKFKQIEGSIGRKSMNTPIQGRWPWLNSVNSVKAEMPTLSQA